MACVPTYVLAMSITLMLLAVTKLITLREVQYHSTHSTLCCTCSIIHVLDGSDGSVTIVDAYVLTCNGLCTYICTCNVNYIDVVGSDQVNNCT